VRRFRLSEIAQRIEAVIEGPGDPEIVGVSGIREAGEGHITFLAHPRYMIYAASTRAAAIIVSKSYSGGTGRPLLRTEDPYLGFLKVLKLFGSDRPATKPGVDPTAILRPGVRLGRDVAIGPHVVVEENAVLGDRVVLMAGTFVGQDAVLGDDTFVYPNAVIRERCRLGRRVMLHPGSVVGSDGFGYVRNGETHHKIPQVGIVVIEDDVEIGANVTIDRATTGATHIKAGAKIDNLVQIAHNVVIEENALLCAQVGISGSTEVGRNVVLGGQAGLVGHIKIGDDAMVGAQAGVTKSVPAHTRVSGYPATEHDQALRIQAHTRKLPELTQAIKDLKARIEQLEKELEREKARVL
jgi:UDP-3-O-[3-hydroxymyristoyl] glucosamine N-acyltransferase